MVGRTSHFCGNNFAWIRAAKDGVEVVLDEPLQFDVKPADPEAIEEVVAETNQQP